MQTIRPSLLILIALAVFASCAENPAAPAAPTSPESAPSPGNNALAGIVIAPELPRSGYDRGDYDYPASIEQRIIDAQGGHFSPYSLRCFTDLRQTDIEHIVAAAEAHDSGAASWTVQRRTAYAQDLANLTTAAPGLNRHEKSDKDPAEWLPANNRCWYVQTWIEVKRKYGLAMDPAEADAIRTVLAGCASTALIKPSCL
ncbi:MAG: HNH endonuclease [Gemmatimonadetes bacterium]|nr:HNH endonuclease [Gemmatimonadota bacterium]MYJ12514.1 HNH endonuclease [Gemmatimonadota bacterium]